MADAFIGEIRAFPYNYVPQGWLPCDGRAIPINQQPALLAVIGITYGGDGRTTFNLPNLNTPNPTVTTSKTMGSAAIGAGTAATGTAYQIGKVYGTENVTLNTTQIPAHNHGLQTQGVTPRQSAPNATTLPLVPADSAVTPTVSYLMHNPATTGPIVNMSPQAVAANTGGASHSNLSPYTLFTYCINTDGVFPVNPNA